MGLTGYGLVGLGIALGLSLWALKLEHGWRLEVEVRLAKEQGRFAAFREEVAEEGRKAEAEKVAREKTWKETNDANVATLAAARAELARRVRDPNRRGTRPDGSAVPAAACPGPVPDGAGGQPPPGTLWVPKADYDGLEDRAARDALRVIGLQRYVREVCLPLAQ